MAISKVTTIHFDMNENLEIKKLIVGDVLDAVYHRGYKSGTNNYLFYMINTTL